MECLKVLPGPEWAQLCQVIPPLAGAASWVEVHRSWVIALLSIVALFFAFWTAREVPLPQGSPLPTAKERAEMLLRESITAQQYQHLLNLGYLEIPSRLYPNRYYRIPRERRRVQVYERSATNGGQPHEKLGELCVIACEPMPDADLVLTHKWLIEADEQKYLNTANWVKMV